MEISQYSIKNLVNPLDNQPINGKCTFKNDYQYIYEYNYNYEHNLFCEIKSSLINVPYLLINNNILEKENNDLPDIYIHLQENGKFKIDFEKPIFCAKNIIFSIHKIKEGKCFDGTYSFILIGRLSETKYNMEKIYIRDKIENEIHIFCNNLSYYDTNYYSFNCYTINDISKPFLNISLLERPPQSDSISIKYSPEFKNKNIIINYTCNNGNIFNSRFRDFYTKFNSTLRIIYPYFSKLLKDIYLNVFLQK